MLKAAIKDMERKLSNSTFDQYRFHHGWTSICPTRRDFITTAVQSAMAAEATTQAILHAKLVDSPLSECSTLCVNDLVDE